MPYLCIILLLLIHSASASGEEDEVFANRALTAIFSEDDSVYRSLVHPGTDQCVKRIWNKKSGKPPTDYGYKISAITQQTIDNANMGARMVGLKEAAFTVEPTHQIELTWTEKSRHPAGHPCFSEMQHNYPLTLVRVGNHWRVAPLCVSQVEADRLTEERRQLDISNQERVMTVNALYSELSELQLADFQNLLLGIKVKAIYAYAEQLDVDMTTAYAFWDKVCAEYPQVKSD